MNSARLLARKHLGLPERINPPDHWSNRKHHAVQGQVPKVMVTKPAPPKTWLGRTASRIATFFRPRGA